MCNRNMFRPKMPKGAFETKANPGAAGNQQVTQESPEKEVEDEGSTKEKRERTRRGGLRIDINMGGGGRVSRGTNVPR